MTRVSLRLMPLGGSVTYGQGSSHGCGYRKKLRELLVANGFRVHMVGSRKAGSMTNNDNEGWRGYRIDQIMAKAKISVPLQMPNVFTVNCGSNDCLQDFEIDRVCERMAVMLDYLWHTSPGSTVILSTLLVNVDQKAESRILHANEQLRELVVQKEIEKKRIVLADMHGQDGPLRSELTDGTHPNDLGYDKMAKIWYKAIQAAAANNFLQQPSLPLFYGKTQTSGH